MVHLEEPERVQEEILLHLEWVDGRERRGAGEA
jgi:hypothetical protein